MFTSPARDASDAFRLSVYAEEPMIRGLVTELQTWPAWLPAVSPPTEFRCEGQRSGTGARATWQRADESSGSVCIVDDAAGFTTLKLVMASGVHLETTTRPRVEKLVNIRYSAAPGGGAVAVSADAGPPAGRRWGRQSVLTRTAADPVDRFVHQLLAGLQASHRVERPTGTASSGSRPGRAAG